MIKDADGSSEGSSAKRIRAIAARAALHLPPRDDFDWASAAKDFDSQRRSRRLRMGMLALVPFCIMAVVMQYWWPAVVTANEVRANFARDRLPLPRLISTSGSDVGVDPTDSGAYGVSAPSLASSPSGSIAGDANSPSVGECELRFAVLQSPDDLLIVIAALETTLEEIEVLNHGDVRWATRVRIPDRSTYVVQPGDTLGHIGQRLRVSVSDLMKANNLISTSIVPGKRLAIPEWATRREAEQRFVAFDMGRDRSKGG